MDFIRAKKPSTVFSKRGVVKLSCLTLLLFPLILFLLIHARKTDYVEANDQRDRILDRYFTSEASKELKEVPLRIGELGAGIGLSVGDDIGSRIAGLWWGYPWERQVIVEPKCGDIVIFHEYVHQADYLGLIPREDFLDALEKMRNEPAYVSQLAAVESTVSGYSSNFYTRLALLYDDGADKEMVAHIADQLAFSRYDWPDYMISIYSRALKIPVPIKRSRP